jgi:head-tail adaptor
LKEALWSRCKEANDVETEEAIVEQVAKEIEESLFSLYKHDVGSKYKNKYRSLIFNIKDPKNPGLFREIITRQLLPGNFLMSRVNNQPRMFVVVFIF